MIDALDLRLTLSDRLGRNDFADLFPAFVRGAEARLNGALRVNEMLTFATLTLVNGSAALPADFLEVFEVRDERGLRQQAQRPDTITRAGSCGYYSIIGQTLQAYQPSGTRVMSYYAALPSLAGSLTATNWLLAKEPAAYVAACLIEAATQFGDAERLRAAQEELTGALARLKINDDRLRWADAGLRLNRVTP